MRPSVRTSLLSVLIGAVITALVGSSLAAQADITGPDVSGWQHPSGTAINWSAVRANGQSFTFIKATEGATYRNPYFAGDWSGSGSAGLLHGAYHFARPTTAPGSAAAQAQYFVAAAGRQNTAGTLPPVLDLEVSGGLSPSQLITWTSQWLATVKALTGRTPIVYSYPAFWTGNMANTTAFRSYPLWIAGYSHEPAPLGGWAHWTFWQYSSSHTIPGIAGAGDISEFYGTMAQLQAMALIGSAPTTGVVDPWRQGNDFTGDGKVDIGVYRPSTGTWYIRNQGAFRYGNYGDIPVPGDYTGSGKASLAVFRPSTGMWYVQGRLTGTHFGQAGDIPVPGDYTGSGHTQIAVYRPSTNVWYVLGLPAYRWGQPGDIPVPGNFNGGDGGDDFAVYRPSTGQWWIPGYRPVVYGQAGDQPLPARYGGSLATTLGVYRPSTHTWYMLGHGAVVTGSTGDTPIASDLSSRGYAGNVICTSAYRWYVGNGYQATYGVRGDIPVSGSNVPLLGATPLALVHR